MACVLQQRAPLTPLSKSAGQASVAELINREHSYPDQTLLLLTELTKGPLEMSDLIRVGRCPAQQTLRLLIGRELFEAQCSMNALI